MHTRASLCGFGAAAALIATPALAHHAGGVSNIGAAGPIVTISASTLEQGHSIAGVSVDYVSLNQLSDQVLINATAAGEDVHGLRTLQAYALTYAFGVTNDLMVALRLPWVRRTGIREAEERAPLDFHVHDHGPADGLGDLSLLGQYRFYNRGGLEAAVLAGVKMPTGRTGERTNEGDVFETEFQPGSGSWDGLFGLAVTRRLGPWSFDANILYTLVTEGTQDTDLGDRFQYNAAVSYRLVGQRAGPGPMFHGAHSHGEGDDGHGHFESAGPALDLVLEVNGEWHAKKKEDGARDDNSGGNTIFISPGLRLSIDQWSGYLSFGIPVVNDLNGIQAEPDWRLIGGASLVF